MWQPIHEGIGYFKGAVNQGVIYSESGVILIDTGLDKQAARKLIRLLHELDRKPIAIINTHAHADHFGGNLELLSHYGEQLKVYAPIFEETVICYPIWEPSYLYGGAYPLAEMENKFLLAPASPVHMIFDVGRLEIDGVELDVIPLYGHSYRQMGIGFEDVLFAADGFYGTEVLDKHRIPFHIDTKETLATLDRLLNMPFEYLIPGHGDAIHLRTDQTETMTRNRIVYERVNQLIIQALKLPQTIDQLQTTISRLLGIEATNSGSFLLYRTAIQAQLKYLLDENAITQKVHDNQWLWEIS